MKTPVERALSSDSSPGQGAVNSNRESERVSRHFEDLGELLPWFAARALDEESS
jgi:hypothetical protein